MRDPVLRGAPVPEGDAELVAHELWVATHGPITLELGGYLIAPYDAERCFEAQVVGLMVGAGDMPQAATASVAASRRRFDDEVASVQPGGDQQSDDQQVSDRRAGSRQASAAG